MSNHNELSFCIDQDKAEGEIETSQVTNLTNFLFD